MSYAWRATLVFAMNLGFGIQGAYAIAGLTISRQKG